MPTLDQLDADGTLIVSLAGPAKSGKTHLACTAPLPIFYHQFDLGSLKRVKSHLPAETLKQITYYEYPRLAAEFIDVNPAGLRALAQEWWRKFVKQYKADVIAAASCDPPGTVVIDTETIEWELNQQANVDPEAKKAGAMKYSLANAEQAGMIDYARNSEHRCNLILLHQMREIWEYDPESKGWKASGKFEPDRQKHVLAGIDVAAQMFRPAATGSAKFRMKIVECGLNPYAEGLMVDDLGEPTWSNFRLALGV